MLTKPVFHFFNYVLLAVLAVPVAAQELGPGDWGLRCEPQGCIVLKPVLNGDGKRLMSLTFAVPVDGGSVRMAILTPLGTALEGGLRLSYGIVSNTYRFTTCMPDGCAVMVDLTADQLSNMIVQPSLEVSFNAVNRVEPYEATILLEGLDEALDMAIKGGAK